jgi:hypothetical protein
MAYNLGMLIRPDVAVGSKPVLTASKSEFRFYPESGLRADIAACPFVPTCDIERAGRPKEKAARRRLSILIIVDQAAINAGFDFGRWAALADNDF